MSIFISWLKTTGIHSVFRHMFFCTRNTHRFIEVVDNDPVDMMSGYYCLDCLKFVPKSDISQFRSTCEVYDDILTIWEHRCD